MDTSYLRALRSPSPAAFAVAANNNRTAANPEARAANSSVANSLNEVIDLSPTGYRESLRTFMVEHYKLAQTYYRSRSTLAKLEKHLSAGTWPSEIQGIHTPKNQFSKEFLEAHDGNAMEVDDETQQPRSAAQVTAKNFLAEVDQEVLNFKTKMLVASISARQAEVNYLHGRLRRSAINDQVVDIINKRHEELVALHVADNHTTQPPSSKSSSILAQEKGILSQDIFIYITRVVDIAGGKAIAELETALNKMKLKEAAKDPQEGPAITNDSLADTVRKAVQEALRKEKGMNAGSNESTSKRKYTDSNCVTSEHEEKRQRKGQGDQKVLKRFLNETQRQGQEEMSPIQRRHQFVEGEERKDSEKQS